MACPNNRPSNRLRNRPSDRPSDRHGNRLPNRPINRPSNRSSDRPSEKRKEMTLTLVCLHVARRYAGLDAFIKARKQAKNATFSHAMVDDHGNFPRWPLDVGNGSVGGLPMVNFPEVSMWGRSPWGGWGANPLPNRFEGTKNLFSAIARVDQRRRHSAVSRGLHRAAPCFCADRRAFVLIGVLSALCCPNRGTHPLCCVQNWARFRTVAADRGVRQLRHFFRHFSDHVSRISQLRVSPHAPCDVLVWSIEGPCLLGADWCLQSDVTTNPRLQEGGWRDAILRRHLRGHGRGDCVAALLGLGTHRQRHAARVRAVRAHSSATSSYLPRFFFKRG